MTGPSSGISEEAGMTTVIVRGKTSGLAQEVTVGAHRFVADEPRAAGGTETGPNPYDLLLAALGT